MESSLGLESLDDEYDVRLYVNVKFSIYALSILVMTAAYVIQHIVASLFGQEIFMIANPVFLFISMKLGTKFAKSFSSRFFDHTLNHDIMDDFYSILLIILSISVILQVTIMPNNEFKFPTTMALSTMTLFGMSSILLASLLLLYAATILPQ